MGLGGIVFYVWAISDKAAFEADARMDEERSDEL
jgi:hypothetical protein